MRVMDNTMTSKTLTGIALVWLAHVVGGGYMAVCGTLLVTTHDLAPPHRWVLPSMGVVASSAHLYLYCSRTRPEAYNDPPNPQYGRHYGFPGFLVLALHMLPIAVSLAILYAVTYGVVWLATLCGGALMASFVVQVTYHTALLFSAEATGMVLRSVLGRTSG